MRIVLRPAKEIVCELRVIIENEAVALALLYVLSSAIVALTRQEPVPAFAVKRLPETEQFPLINS